MYVYPTPITGVVSRGHGARGVVCQGSVCRDKLTAKYSTDIPDQLPVMSLDVYL